MSEKRVQITARRGETFIFVDTEITAEDVLQFSGQDTGQAPKEYWGDDDYEYWFLIPAEQKDRVLLALLEELYQGNPRAVSEFQSFL
jgi:hypothetical protein